MSDSDSDWDPKCDEDYDSSDGDSSTGGEDVVDDDFCKSSDDEAEPSGGAGRVLRRSKRIAAKPRVDYSDKLTDKDTEFDPYILYAKEDFVKTVSEKGAYVYVLRVEGFDYTTKEPVIYTKVGGSTRVMERIIEQCKENTWDVVRVVMVFRVSSSENKDENINKYLRHTYPHMHLKGIKSNRKHEKGALEYYKATEEFWSRCVRMYFKKAGRGELVYCDRHHMRCTNIISTDLRTV